MKPKKKEQSESKIWREQIETSFDEGKQEGIQSERKRVCEIIDEAVWELGLVEPNDIEKLCYPLYLYKNKIKAELLEKLK